MMQSGANAHSLLPRVNRHQATKVAMASGANADHFLLRLGDSLLDLVLHLWSIGRSELVELSGQ